MIPAPLFFGCIGALVFGLGLYSLFLHRHAFRRILALNAMGSGCFLFIGAIGLHSGTEARADALSQAFVITGIVVSVSATALALALAARIESPDSDAETGGSHE